MPKTLRLRRGLNIPLKGEAEKVFTRLLLSETYAVKPTDFPGLIPKLMVAEGDSVQVGSPLFCDKNNPSIQYVSPASGTVQEVVRGDRRKILEVVVKPDGTQQHIDFGKAFPKDLTREDIIAKMLVGGVWPLLVQRPYAVVPNPADTPRDIFVSGFDTAPLAPDLDFAIKDEYESFQLGIDALAKLTTGKVFLGLNSDYPPSTVYTKCKGVEFRYFSGPHPVGNVGVQIHHTAPIGKGDVIWTIDPLNVIILGRLFAEGYYNPTKVVALTGSEVIKPRYFITSIGASIEGMVESNLAQPAEKLRFISGNILTGNKIDGNGHLGTYHNMVTVIPEGNHYDFLGWAAPGFNKYSKSSTFLSKLFPFRKYALHTNMNGGVRSFVVTGQYEKVVPMDIYPVLLLKAILANDIEKMENLGIYEIAEEDFALCEFVCTSKISVQQIVRDGIDLMIKELN